MATAIPARLIPAESRHFGLTVGGALILFALISRWRGHEVAPFLLGAVGLTLTVFGVVAPSALSPVLRSWMRIGVALATVTTPLFLSIVFFGVLTPTGWLMRIFGKNPVRARLVNGSYWVERTSTAADNASLTRQF